jgi:hypothetical protein
VFSRWPNQYPHAVGVVALLDICTKLWLPW